MIATRGTSHLPSGLKSSFGWKKLADPPYYPELAPKDYRLHPSLEHFIGDKKYDSLDAKKLKLIDYFYF